MSARGRVETVWANNGTEFSIVARAAGLTRSRYWWLVREVDVRYPIHQWGAAIGVLLIAVVVLLFVLPALMGLVLLLSGNLGQ